MTVAEALHELDRRVLSLTGHMLVLRGLFPFALAGLGVVLTLENGLGLGMLPAWLSLWLAFDAFVKLHPPSRLIPSLRRAAVRQMGLNWQTLRRPREAFERRSIRILPSCRFA